MMAKKKTNKKRDVQSDETFVAAVMLFAGGCILLIALMQSHETIKYLMLGFGSALLVFCAVLSGLATKHK
jgi:mannose/fructose/N-acetylgalactosamine-specific phosphotransferase system component IIC